MFAAFILVTGLHGQVLGSGESATTYETIEACDAVNKAHGEHVAQQLDAEGVGFADVRLKCDDPNKPTFEVFGVGPPA